MDKIKDLLNYTFPKFSDSCITVLAILIYLILTGLYYIFIGLCIYTGVNFTVMLWL